MTPSQLTAMGKALLVTLLLAGCAQTEVAKDGAEERTSGVLAPCGYLGDHDIYYRLGCLRARLEGMMMPPNSRLASDASASARRASYSAPQSER
jgi:hypothetical protein